MRVLLILAGCLGLTLVQQNPPLSLDKTIPLPEVQGRIDHMFFDAKGYATGGEGAISVFQQQDADHYAYIATVPTRKGARTSFLSPESHSLYVAARRQGSEAAAIYVYHLQP